MKKKAVPKAKKKVVIAEDSSDGEEEMAVPFDNDTDDPSSDEAPGRQQQPGYNS